MRIGLYGGSFDPIHHGHIEPVRCARECFSLDQVWFLPTAQPPHKRDRQMAPALARYTMVELALLEEPAFLVSSEEMEREKPSYTVETLERLRKAMPDDDLFLLVGSDSYRGLSTWYRWRELAELATLGILPRPGAPLEVERLEAPELRAWIASGQARIVSDPPSLEISSSEIRRAIACGDAASIAGQVPDLVLDYLSKYDLYHET